MNLRLILLTSLLFAVTPFAAAQPGNGDPFGPIDDSGQGAVLGSQIVLDAQGNMISVPPAGSTSVPATSGFPTAGMGNAYPQTPQTQTAYPGAAAYNPPLGGKTNWRGPFAYHVASDNGETPITTSPDQDFQTNLSPSKTVRSGAFQRINAAALWAPSGGNDSLGITELDLSALFGFAAFRKESPLLISPGFSVWFLDGQFENVKASHTLYAATCEVRWLKPLAPQYILDLGATPGIHSDFKTGSSKSFRIPAHAGLIWNFNPRTKIFFGCAYLDRDDYPWMPYGGLIWTPEESEMIFELVFPKPKISKRIRWWGVPISEDVSDWLYFAGEFAGGRWAIEPNIGEDVEMLEYRDIRIMLGWERKSVKGLNLAFEVGGLLDRHISLGSDANGRSPGENVFLRLKASY